MQLEFVEVSGGSAPRLVLSLGDGGLANRMEGVEASDTSSLGALLLRCADDTCHDAQRAGVWVAVRENRPDKRKEKSGFQLRRGGGGGSIEAPKTGGFGKRAQLTGPLISYY